MTSTSNRISHGHPIMQEGRRVRDALKLSGQHPQVLRKLEDIVELHHIHGGTALKLQNLLNLVEASK